MRQEQRKRHTNPNRSSNRLGFAYGKPLPKGNWAKLFCHATKRHIKIKHDINGGIRMNDSMDVEDGGVITCRCGQEYIINIKKKDVA